ncbi:MAG: sigma-70 family RNA polymerase sigma factor [Acidobacteriota bacterium]
MSSESIRRPPKGDDDVMLLGRIADGDDAALGVLYDRYARLLLSLARRVLHDDAEAEEIVQEALLQVWRQAGRYDSRRSSVSTWLVLITRSRAIDRVRSRQVKQRTLDTVAQENREVHTSPEGARTVLHEQRRRRLHTALATLPAEQRQVLELAFFQGMTQSEISSATDIPLGTVKTRTLLAMKKLRVALRDEIDELL